MKNPFINKLLNGQSVVKNPFMDSILNDEKIRNRTGYYFYLGGIILPVAPSSLEIKSKSNNQVVNLINEGEVNILKSHSLYEVSFEMLLPRFQMPFGHPGNFSSDFYLGYFKLWQKKKKILQLVIVRLLPNFIPLSPTVMRCTLEDYEIIEDANNGFDVVVKVNLKQYKKYALKELEIVEEASEVATNAGDATKAVATTTTRIADTAPEIVKHTVKKGDTLWNIAKKTLGDGARWKEIYNLNKNIIKNPSVIDIGMELILP